MIKKYLQVSGKIIYPYIEHCISMTVRIHEQERLKNSVNELFGNYSNIEVIGGELESLGFLKRVEKPTLIVMENPDLELYIQIELLQGDNIKGYDILTFEEIEDALR